MAFCVVGLLQRLSPDRTGLRQVTQAFGGDVFVVLSGPPGRRPPEHLVAFAKDVQVFADPGVEGLREEALRIDSKGASLHALSGRLFAHPLTAPPGTVQVDSGAFQLRDMSLCFARVRTYEASRQAQYKYVVYVRADTYWLTNLPPLHLLRDMDPQAVWIPDGCDSDGINDRMAIVPRRWGLHYFDRWTLLLNGTLLALIRRASGRDQHAERGAEWLLYAVLRGFRVPVLRFTPVAAVVCVANTGKPAHGSCTAPLPLGVDRVAFKYAQEASEAIQAAGWLSRSWVWRRAQSPWMQPGCFASDEEARGCCDEWDNGWGGRPQCFNDVWYFWRCCGPGAGLLPVDHYASVLPWRWGVQATAGRGSSPPVLAEGIWVLPRPELAKRHVEEGLSPLCYRLAETASRCVDPETAGARVYAACMSAWRAWQAISHHVITVPHSGAIYPTTTVTQHFLLIVKIASAPSDSACANT